MPEKPENEKSPKVLKVEILPPRDEGEEQYSAYSRKPGSSRNVIWTYSSYNNPGCLIASITFGIFLVLVAKYGLLAGIGFIVFHIIGSIASALLASRALIAGRPFSPWPARILNWLVCTLLTVWLAGGQAG